METEIWKHIPDTIGYYASNLGRIKGPQKVLNPASNGKAGYLQCSVRMCNGTRICRTVHSMIALAFHGPRPTGLDIAHRDNDKTNNRPDNLRYCTRRDNLKDSRYTMSWGHKLTPATRDTPIISQRTRKLTPAQRLEIVNRIIADDYQSDIANDFNISQSTVSRIWFKAMVA